MRSEYPHIISLFDRWSRILIFACLLLFYSLCATAQTSREYQVKAVFLYNFTQFIEWPPAALGSAGDPFVIGIVGADPFGDYLNQTIAGEKVQGHPLVVKRYSDLKEIKDCHILFVNQPAQTADVLNVVSNHSILTVSDISNFARAGGMIRFFTENNKIRLQINPSAAKGAKLTISSKLLRLAEIVEN